MTHEGAKKDLKADPDSRPTDIRDYALYFTGSEFDEIVIEGNPKPNKGCCTIS